MGPLDPIVGLANSALSNYDLSGGSILQTVNFTLNPVYGAVKGFYEMGSGQGMDYETLGTQLDWQQRTMSGISGTLNTAAIVLPAAGFLAAETTGTRIIGSADSAGRRGLSALGDEGAVFPTNAIARAKAAELGYTPVRQVPFNSHGQQVFKSGKNFITRDVDSHSGGAWKLFDSRGNRLGTYNEDLTVRIGK